MSRFSEALNQKDFLVTMELDPPKGTDLSAFLATAKDLAGRVDALVVSDNAGAVARMDAVTAARELLADSQAEVIVTLTCRDRNRLALTSAMLAAAAAGLENLLLVSGDYVTLGDHPQAKGVYDLDSVQALSLAATLNQGNDLSGGELSGNPGFFLGAVVSPAAEPQAAQLMKLNKKLTAGAQFFITQPITDLEQYRKFQQRTEKVAVKILVGVETGENLDLEAAGALITELKNAGAAGVHLSTPGRPEDLASLLSASGR
jgi:5,10-methylenetetrahydrofolate reductase